jgi:hypothetical protein
VRGGASCAALFTAAILLVGSQADDTFLPSGPQVQALTAPRDPGPPTAPCSLRKTRFARVLRGRHGWRRRGRLWGGVHDCPC